MAAAATMPVRAGLSGAVLAAGTSRFHSLLHQTSLSSQHRSAHLRPTALLESGLSVIRFLALKGGDAGLSGQAITDLQEQTQAAQSQLIAAQADYDKFKGLRLKAESELETISAEVRLSWEP